MAGVSERLSLARPFCLKIPSISERLGSVRPVCSQMAGIRERDVVLAQVCLQMVGISEQGGAVPIVACECGVFASREARGVRRACKSREFASVLPPRPAALQAQHLARNACAAARVRLL